MTGFRRKDLDEAELLLFIESNHSGKTNLGKGRFHTFHFGDFPDEFIIQNLRNRTDGFRCNVMFGGRNGQVVFGAGVDTDIIEKLKLIKCICDIILDSLAEGEHRDKCSDSDHHSENRQKSAQLLLPQVGKRLLDVIGDSHRFYLILSSWITFPSCR